MLENVASKTKAASGRVTCFRTVTPFEQKYNNYGENTQRETNSKYLISHQLFK